MKLLNYTSTYFAAILLALISVWAVIFYFEMLSEIYDSLDDGLENRKILVIQKAQENPSILNTSSFGEGLYRIKEIDYQHAKHFKDSYLDSLMYMQNEEGKEPIRLLKTVFRHGDAYYKMELATSMVEEDDLIRNLLYSVLFLYLGLIASILIINNLVLRKTWKPFYKLLSQLKSFSIEKDDQVNFEKTNIEEFSLLNESIQKMLQKSKASFKNQKQFIENASHELQTPLAISINQLELLIENNHFDAKQIETISVVLNNLERLTRLNKSLLLLSKIENRQYTDENAVNINEIIKNILIDFEDFAAFHAITFDLVENQTIHFNINQSLVVILFTNLIKNAMIHGNKDSIVEVEIGNSKVCIKNYGARKSLDQHKLFQRFMKQDDTPGSSGLGLAICMAIAKKYNLNLSYSFTDQHRFEVDFAKIDSSIDS